MLSAIMAIIIGGYLVVKWLATKILWVFSAPALFVIFLWCIFRFSYLGLETHTFYLAESIDRMKEIIKWNEPALLGSGFVFLVIGILFLS